MFFEFLEKIILGNSLFQWLFAAAIVIFTTFVLWLVTRMVGRRLAKIGSRTETPWDDIAAAAIKKTKILFIFIVGLYFGAFFLELPERIRIILENFTIIALLIQTGIWGLVIIAYLIEHYRQRAVAKNPAAVTTVNLIGFVSKIILWSIVVLLAFDNLGVDITAMIAGLGIGGIAIALAVQNILSDLFASLSIMVDKPFEAGDFLIINEYLGSVEHIGLKTTRLRSLSGEQLVFSNSDLLNSRIRNYGRMFERRVVFTIGVTYDTPREKLMRIPGIIREAIEAQDKTRFDRSHFMKYGDYSLDFETVYYVLSPEYNVYMDIQQAINFMIHERFEQENIEFAYPTQKLFVESIEPSLSA